MDYHLILGIVLAVLVVISKIKKVKKLIVIILLAAALFMGYRYLNENQATVSLNNVNITIV